MPVEVKVPDIVVDINCGVERAAPLWPWDKKMKPRKLNKG